MESEAQKSSGFDIGFLFFFLITAKLFGLASRE
jgi:hypothetical protein